MDRLALVKHLQFWDNRNKIREYCQELYNLFLNNSINSNSNFNLLAR